MIDICKESRQSTTSLDNFLHLLGLRHTKIVRGYLFYYPPPPSLAAVSLLVLLSTGGATLFTPHNATRTKPASTRDLTPGILPRIGLLQWRGDQGGASVLSRLRRCHRAFTTWRCGVTRTALRESRH
jgi:hypothetical protein